MQALKLNNFSYKTPMTVSKTVVGFNSVKMEICKSFGGESKTITNSSEGFNNGNSANANDYTYDLNGNMISDLNKNITKIIYNHLNLPTKITIGTNNIEYIYTANGTKITKKAGTDVTNYLGNFIYTNKILSMFSTAEGHVKNALKTSATLALSYVYLLDDHLGNIRLSFSDTDKNGTISTAEIIETNDYYPFGMLHKGYGTNTYNNWNQFSNKKFNGKEFDFSLNTTDFGARTYMNDLGRFMQHDPLSSKTLDIYGFGYNNPLKFIDPTGMAPDDWVLKKDGSIYWDNNAVSQATTKQGETYLGTTGSYTSGGYKVNLFTNSEGKGDWNYDATGSYRKPTFDPSTIGKNIISGLSYPGGNNPKMKSDKELDDFSYVPKYLAEYPAIGHDRRYDNLEAKGVFGLLLDPRTIPADDIFVGQELGIAFSSSNGISLKDRIYAFALGVGLGAVSSPKKLAIRSFLGEDVYKTSYSYYYILSTISKKGIMVDNKPTGATNTEILIQLNKK